jgi:nitroimidazol reductase NimA-like FMN-containing flavoprotein (pyridoxamine 5'-phosphate oxidase superfamily)
MLGTAGPAEAGQALNLAPDRGSFSAMRRKDKEIADPREQERVLRSAKYVTIAMIDRGQPYLVTLSHGFDIERNCLYFHCAAEGRKLDALLANPEVYGQALIDHGYVVGSCSHLFETVQFTGLVRFVVSMAEKRHALETMIRQLEPDPGPVIAAETGESSVANVTIGRIDITSLSGKRAKKAIAQP